MNPPNNRILKDIDRTLFIRTSFIDRSLYLTGARRDKYGNTSKTQAAIRRVNPQTAYFSKTERQLQYKIKPKTVSKIHSLPKNRTNIRKKPQLKTAKTANRPGMIDPLYCVYRCMISSK